MEMQPQQRRIRVLLGQPPVTMNQIIAHPHDRTLVNRFSGTMDDHYAAVIEREVLRKGRRALLIAGSGHLLRGIRADDNKQHHLNAASQIVHRHPNTLYVVDVFMLPPAGSPNQNPKVQQMQQEIQRAAAKFVGWPRPAIASLTGTWLGAVTETTNPWIIGLAYRAVSATAARYEAEADAILYLGPGEVLTSSQPDPAIYHWGAYPQQLQHAGAIAGAGNQLSYGLHWAQAAPSWFALFDQ